MVVIVDVSVFSFLFALMTISTEPSSVPSADLDAFHWRNRVVLSFVSEKDRQSAREQREYRRNALREWRDRDLVLVEVGPQAKVSINQEPRDDLDATALRERFAAPTDRYFAVLVGKDGFEKLRASEAISNDVLFATIDAMPMRRREMLSR